jgi:hypothetical protein
VPKTVDCGTRLLGADPHWTIYTPLVAQKRAATRCREHRLAVREKLQAERARALAELRAKGEAERGEARGTCALDKGEAEKATRGALESGPVVIAAAASHASRARTAQSLGSRAYGTPFDCPWPS